MLTEQQRLWVVVWGALVGAGVTAELVALRSGQPHAPLSHYLRYVTPKGWPGKAALLLLGWKLHEHLHPRQGRA